MPNRYEEKPNLYDVYYKIGGVESKLEEMSKNITTILEGHDEDIKIIRQDLKGIHQVQNQFIGKVGVVGVIAGFIGTIIVAVFTRFIKN